MGRECVIWINLNKDKDRSSALTNTVMILRFETKAISVVLERH
jgi:hypothetical protein